MIFGGEFYGCHGISRREVKKMSWRKKVFILWYAKLTEIILDGLEEKAQNMGAKQIMLNAREPAIPFYRTYGYTIIGPAHTLYDSIKHVKMVKELKEKKKRGY